MNRTPYNYTGQTGYGAPSAPNIPAPQSNQTSSDYYSSGAGTAAYSPSGAGAAPYPPYHSGYTNVSQPQAGAAPPANQYNYTGASMNQQWNNQPNTTAATQQPSQWGAPSTAQTNPWSTAGTTQAGGPRWSQQWAGTSGQAGYWNQSSSTSSHQPANQWPGTGSEPNPWVARTQADKPTPYHSPAEGNRYNYPPSCRANVHSAQPSYSTQPRPASSNIYSSDYQAACRPPRPPPSAPIARHATERSFTPRPRFRNPQSEVRPRGSSRGFNPRPQMDVFLGARPKGVRGSAPGPKFRAPGPPKSGSQERQSRFDKRPQDNLRNGPWGPPPEFFGADKLGKRRDRSDQRSSSSSRNSHDPFSPNKRSNAYQSLMSIRMDGPGNPEGKFRFRGCRAGKDKRMQREGEKNREQSFGRPFENAKRGRDWSRDGNKNNGKKRNRNDSERSYDLQNAARKRKVTDDYDEDDEGVMRVTFSTRDESYKFYCTICKIHCKQEPEFQEHLRGKKHQARVKNLEEEGGQMKDEMLDGEEVMGDGVEFTEKDIEVDTEIMQIPFGDEEKMKTFCVPCRFALSEKKNMTCHVMTPKHKENEAALAVLRKTAGPNQELCKSCAVVVVASEVESHRETTEHKRLTRYKCAACEICQMRYNDVKILEEHLKGERHDVQLERLEKVTKNLENLPKLAKYFKKVAANKIVRAQTTCLLCSTACGNYENKEFHDIFETDHHKDMEKKAAEISETQFFCYVCVRTIQDEDRRIHFKRDAHKTNREKKSKFFCEECCMQQKSEKALLSHFFAKPHQSKVQRTKMLVRHLEKTCSIDRKAKLNEGLTQLLEIYPEIKAQPDALEPAEKDSPKTEVNPNISAEAETNSSEGVSVESESVKSNGQPVDEAAETKRVQEKAEVIPPRPGLDQRKAMRDVMPMIGEYCVRCKQFFTFDAPLFDLCPHIRVARGYPLEKPATPMDEEPEIKDVEGNQGDEEEGDSAHNIKEKIESAHSAQDKAEEVNENEQQK